MPYIETQKMTSGAINHNNLKSKTQKKAVPKNPSAKSSFFNAGSFL
jgi:hypothetical protein